MLKFVLIFLCFINIAQANIYQKILNSLEIQMDRYFLLRSSDQTCINMFINHIDTVNRLMSEKSDQSIKAWSKIGITPQDGDRHWFQYLQKNNLLVENGSSEITYKEMLEHINHIKGNAGLFFQHCLKEVWRARLQCSRQAPLEERQRINECIKNEEESINLKQITSSNYFLQLEEKEQEELLKQAKETSLRQSADED